MEVYKMLGLFSGFSALREGRHFDKICREVKVSLLFIIKRSWEEDGERI